jgi:acyl dehydratase
VTGPALVETLQPGDELRPLVRVPTREQCVRYAGAANDFSPIHYDDANARRRGFDQIIVHGLLKAAFLGDLLETWSAPQDGWVQRLSTQYRGTDAPGQPLICRARVADKRVTEGRCRVDLELWIDNSRGETTTRGTATVVFEPKAEEQR